MKNARTTMKEIDPAAARAVAWPVQAAPVSCFTSAAGSVELATNPNPTRRPGEIAGREGLAIEITCAAPGERLSCRGRVGVRGLCCESAAQQDAPR